MCVCVKVCVFVLANWLEGGVAMGVANANTVTKVEVELKDEKLNTGGTIYTEATVTVTGSGTVYYTTDGAAPSDGTATELDLSSGTATFDVDNTAEADSVTVLFFTSNTETDVAEAIKEETLDFTVANANTVTKVEVELKDEKLNTGGTIYTEATVTFSLCI